jgi:hypothetical protein
MQRKQNVIMAQRQSQAKATQEKHQQLVIQTRLLNFYAVFRFKTSR